MFITDPLEVRKATLASIVAKARPGIRFNEHIEGDGVFAHVSKLGLEGIGSKRKDSAYRSRRSPQSSRDFLRLSLNSFGPLISLRLRSWRSSSVADGSLRRSISWAAISDAFAALFVSDSLR